MKRRRKMHRRKPHSPFWTYCALAILVAAFFLFNVVYSRKRMRYMKMNQQQQLSSTASAGSIRGKSFAKMPFVPPRERWISSDALAFNDKGTAEKAKNLIIVAGHSVTTSGHLEDADRDERDWYLLPYQIHRGLPQAILAHIQAGLNAAFFDPAALLVFSGGATRATAGPGTEGESYFRVVDAKDMWPQHSNVRARTTVEEYATDSFQNLLFSICRFREITGQYPEKITMISFSFKQTRFETMHAAALRWRPDQFVFIGVDPDESTGFDLQASSQGELENAAKPFESDPYGCHSEVLVEKRKSRDPFHRTAPYELTCPEMKEILSYCGPELIAGDKLPWKTTD